MTAEPDLPINDAVPAPTKIESGNLFLWNWRQMQVYAQACVDHATAPLQAEIEALRAEVREAREFRDKMANAIGNDQLRRFIEKHGEPVPLTTRMQEAEARAERLAEALRWAERHCPCGARPESPDTHPHVPGCLVGAALAQEDRND